MAVLGTGAGKTAHFPRHLAQLSEPTQGRANVHYAHTRAWKSTKYEAKMSYKKQVIYMQIIVFHEDMVIHRYANS